MLSFISFGSGSSGNCYLIGSPTDSVLIDAGIGSRKLKKYFRDYGICTSNIRCALITHDHADHIKSVGSISHEYNIPIYATEGVHRGIERNYSVHHKVSRELKRTITVGVPFTVADFEIISFDVPHDSTGNVGYCLTYKGLRFCIMTDIGQVTEEMNEYIRTANYLVIESNYDEEMLVKGVYPDYLKRRIHGSSGHLSNRACADAIVRNLTSGLRRIWLCHLSEENNHPELARKTIEMSLEEAGPDKCDGLRVEVLKRRTPSGMFELDD